MSISGKSVHQELWTLTQKEDVANKLGECMSPRRCCDIAKVYASGG